MRVDSVLHPSRAIDRREALRCSIALFAAGLACACGGSDDANGSVDAADSPDSRALQTRARDSFGSQTQPPSAVASADPSVNVSERAARNEASDKASLDVRDYGAVGDGRHDDTVAFQAAMKAVPAAGGTVTVSPGRYLIDPARTVRLASGVHLRMAPEAVLVAMRTSALASTVLLVSGDDVIISGGAIEGGGYSGRGVGRGLGIAVRGGRRVRVTNVRIDGFTFDSVYVGHRGGAGARESMDILLENCSMSRSGRQGVSVTSCAKFRMIGCSVSFIGPVRPSAGIDVEPNAGYRVDDVEIRGCSFSDIEGRGVQIAREGITNVVIANNTMLRCGRGGIQVRGGNSVDVRSNRISNSTPAVSVLRGASGVVIADNGCGGNGIHVEAGAGADRRTNDC